MQAKWRNVYGILAILLCLVPLAAVAQDYDHRWRLEHGRHRPRGPIQVTNDWRDDVKVTVWTHRREQVAGYWRLDPGATTLLAVDGDPIRVRPSYKIKVGDDWGWVDIEEVAQFSHGVWYVNVRDIWRATHQRRDRRAWAPGVPDWQR